jgi:hypothetical protein
MTASNDQQFDPPKSSFRDSYTDLVLAIWEDPELENQITENPALITQYGFTVVPRSIRFEPPGATVNSEEYEAYMAEFAADKEVTLHIPQKPTIVRIQPQYNVTREGEPIKREGNDSVTLCCCCTPCCSGGCAGKRQQ